MFTVKLFQMTSVVTPLYNPSNKPPGDSRVSIHHPEFKQGLLPVSETNIESDHL